MDMDERQSFDDPQDTGMPDSVETDAAALSSAESLDEDRLRVDPLEEGIEPPERWSAVDRFGTTATEQLEGESIEQRLEEEEPDVEPLDVPERPLAVTPADQLDDSIDDMPADVESVAPEETPSERHHLGEERQYADGDGRSVAQTIRTPEEEPR